MEFSINFHTDVNTMVKRLGFISLPLHQVSDYIVSKARWLIDMFGYFLVVGPATQHGKPWFPLTEIFVYTGHHKDSRRKKSKKSSPLGPFFGLFTKRRYGTNFNPVLDGWRMWDVCKFLFPMVMLRKATRFKCPIFWES